MAHTEHEIDLREVARDSGPYPVEAYLFVREGLNHTVSRIHADTEGLTDVSRHVSGQQLCIGLRDFAIERYGLLAPTVLRTWNINRTDDFGRIVFAMIDHGLMSKTAEDSLEDFRAVFDFEEAFARESLERRVGRG
ncbi:MAG: Minf_1886 family protein [Phycisphaerales bacterium]